MARTALHLLLPFAISTVFTPGCRGGTGGGTEGTGTGTDGTTLPATSGTSQTTETGSSTTSGGSAGSAGTETGDFGTLLPCDPTEEGFCEPDLCAGLPQAGFYCRPPCPNGSAHGDPCGENGVCLPSLPLPGAALACFELVPCDPVTGSGCNIGAGETCAVLDADPLRTTCEPASPGVSGTACGPGGGLACDVGLGCMGADLDGQDPGVCTPWCIPGDPLPAGCSTCIPATDAIGTCSACGILGDDCPAGEQCHPVNELGGGICQPYGPVGEDAPCSLTDPAQACQQGLLCIEVADEDFRCIPTCDPNTPMCTDPDKTCNDVGVVLPDLPNGQLGLCLAQEQMFCEPGVTPTGCAAGAICLGAGAETGICADPCDPMTGPAACGGNYACLPTTADGDVFLAPFLHGNGACGDGCTTDADCSGPTRCLGVAGLETAGLCGLPCDPAVPNACGAAATCVPLPADPQNGVCIADGGACDGTDPASCGPGLTCVSLADDPASGVCVPGCYVQDPAACTQSGGSCQGLADPAYHGGACVGQKLPCDPVAQQGCDLDETCKVLGGGPIGGQALACDDAGGVAEGGDCSADPASCSPGLWCVEDVCRAVCDPAMDTCIQGTCTDLSAEFYLPVGTVGACL